MAHVGLRRDEVLLTEGGVTRTRTVVEGAAGCWGAAEVEDHPLPEAADYLHRGEVADHPSPERAAGLRTCSSSPAGHGP